MSVIPAKDIVAPASVEAVAAPDRTRNRKLEVAKRLPADVRRAVEEAVREAPALSEKVICGIDRRFDLRQRYAISWHGLVRLLRRLRNPDAPTAQRIAAQRKRQGSISVILKKSFGEFATSNPELWERRAYLMLVGLLYERLATNEREISTEELVSLSKMLAENRRVDARKRDPDGNSPALESDGEGLPGKLGGVVQQLYGTDLGASDDDPPGSNGECEAPHERQ